jgi:hypothetical protein
LLLTGFALRRRPPLGFCLTFVFLVLLPTTLYWKMELMFTYRMYLPLAGLVSFVVFVCHLLLERLIHAKRLSRPIGRGIGMAGLVLVTGAMSARTILRNRDFQSQYTLYRSVVDAAPENPRGHYNLANRLIDLYPSLKQKGLNTEADATLKEAIRHYEEAIRLFPKYIEANLNLAIAYGLNGRTDDLIERIEAVLSWDPGHQAAHFNLAQAYRKRGIFARQSGRRAAARRDLEAARAHYRDFLAKQPTYPDAIFGLGTTAYFLDRYDEAAAALEEYLKLNPKSPEALRFLGESLYELSRYSEAEKVIRQFLTIEPTSHWGKAFLRRLVSPPTPRSRQPGQRRGRSL